MNKREKKRKTYSDTHFLFSILLICIILMLIANIAIGIISIFSNNTANTTNSLDITISICSFFVAVVAIGMERAVNLAHQNTVECEYKAAFLIERIEVKPTPQKYFFKIDLSPEINFLIAPELVHAEISIAGKRITLFDKTKDKSQLKYISNRYEIEKDISKNNYNGTYMALWTNYLYNMSKQFKTAKLTTKYEFSFWSIDNREIDSGVEIESEISFSNIIDPCFGEVMSSRIKNEPPVKTKRIK